MHACLTKTMETLIFTHARRACGQRDGCSMMIPQSSFSFEPCRAHDFIHNTLVTLQNAFYLGEFPHICVVDKLQNSLSNQMSYGEMLETASMLCKRVDIQGPEPSGIKLPQNSYSLHHGKGYSPQLKSKETVHYLWTYLPH